jgi:hypothetical protein
MERRLATKAAAKGRRKGDLRSLQRVSGAGLVSGSLRRQASRMCSRASLRRGSIRQPCQPCRKTGQAR